MSDGPLNPPLATLSHTLSHALLRYGQTPAKRHHGALAVWLIGLGALSLALWIVPTQGSIHALESQLRTRTIELGGLNERLRASTTLNHALQTDLNPAPLPTTPAATPRSTPDPWLFLQGLAKTRSVHWLDYTPLPATSKPDCQRLRLKMNGASLAVQGVLNDLLHSPHAIERFTLSPSATPDDRAATTLALQVCVHKAAAPPRAHSSPSTPSAALFQPVPKVAVRPRTALEEHPLSAYRVIATGRAAHDHYALVRTPAGKIHTVRPGVRIGDRSGQVSAILPNGIEVQHDTDRQSLLIGTPP